MMDCSSLKVSELRALCKEKGINTVGMLEKADFARALEATESTPPTTEKPCTEMKVSELKSLCKQRGIDTSGMLEKQDMLNALTTGQTTSSTPTQSQQSRTRRVTVAMGSKGLPAEKATQSAASPKSGAIRRATVSAVPATSPNGKSTRRASSAAAKPQNNSAKKAVPAPKVSSSSDNHQKEMASDRSDTKTTSGTRRASPCISPKAAPKSPKAAARRTSTNNSTPAINTNKEGRKSKPTPSGSNETTASSPNNTKRASDASTRRASNNRRASAKKTEEEEETNQSSSQATTMPGFQRKGTKRRNAVSQAPKPTSTIEAPNLSDLSAAENTTDDEKSPPPTTTTRKDGKSLAFVSLSDASDHSDHLRKVNFAAAAATAAPSDSEDENKRVSFSTTPIEAPEPEKRASFLATRCSKHRQRRIRFSYVVPRESCTSATSFNGFDFDNSSGMEDNSSLHHLDESESGHMGDDSSSHLNGSSQRRSSARRSSTMSKGSTTTTFGRRSTMKERRNRRQSRLRRTTWKADTSWMDDNTAWHTQNSTNYTATDIVKAFKEASPEKWRTDIHQVSVPINVWGGVELKKQQGRSIKKAIEKFNHNPHKYAALMYQTNMTTWPKTQQKYTFVMREEEGRVEPQGVTPPGEAFMTVHIHRFVPLPAFPKNELPECDPYTRKLTHRGQSLPPPFLPGRGMGACDMPNLKIIGDIDPSDIEQGDVGNCWLLCAISALAEFDGAIKKLFRKTKDLDKMPFADGRVNFYTITLYDLETWEEVDYVIDESLCASVQFPGHLLGARPSIDGELWVSYLEKALAIHCGGWDEIDGGPTTHALALMTGCKRQFIFMRNEETHKYQCFGKYNEKTKECTKQYNSPQTASEMNFRVPWPRVGGGGHPNQEFDDNKMFQRMCSWNDYNYVLCAGSKEFQDEAAASGIVQNHAYTVIGCHADVADTGIDLIKMRNPWGAGQVENADFEEDGPGWKLFPEIKAELKPMFVGDGIFYLTKEEFFELFDHIYLSCSDMTVFKED